MESKTAKLKNFKIPAHSWWVFPTAGHYLLLFIATFIPYYIDVPKSLMAYDYLSRFWYQWDSLWYIEIAHHGYELIKGTAFFPFVPLLIRVTNHLSIAWGVTQIGFLICLYLLREFFKRLKMNEKQIRMAICLFALNPCSIFYSTLYTELWTMLFSLLSLHMAIKGKWWFAALFAAILSSVRATALIFGIFPLVLFLFSIFKRDWKTMFRALGWGLSCSIGLACYMFFLWWHFKDPLLFSHVEDKFWAHKWIEPWVQLAQGIKDIQWDIRSPRQGLYIFTVIFTFSGIFGVWKLKSTAPWETWGTILFVIIGLIFNFSFGSQGPLLSTFRYISVLFPVYAVMAVILPYSLRVLILFLSAKIAFFGAWGFIHNNWFL